MHWLCMGKTNAVCITVFSCWTLKILDPNILNSGQRWKLQWFSHTASASIFTQSSLEVQNRHCTVDCSSAALEAAAECQKSWGSTYIENWGVLFWVTAEISRFWVSNIETVYPWIH